MSQKYKLLMLNMFYKPQFKWKLHYQGKKGKQDSPTEKLWTDQQRKMLLEYFELGFCDKMFPCAH